jgi:dihydroorotate dehydrogenase (NAD+) catalytic subunit
VVSGERLTLEVCGVGFANPVVTASGTFNFGREYAQVFPLSLLGGVTTKGTSPYPKPGNPAPRITETPAGMLNSIGLENKGMDRYVADELPWLREQGTRIILNVYGETPAEFAAVCRTCGPLVDLVELNLSCPNVHGGALPFANDPAATAEVTRAALDATDRPVLVKLSPNTDLLRTAEAAERAGCHGFAVINTLLGMRIELDTRRPTLGTGIGGLSGPAIKPVAVRWVHALYPSTDLPIIGMGGISTWRDAIEFALAGASLVAVGTATFADPWAAPKCVSGIAGYLEEAGERWTDLIGAAHRPVHLA